MKKLILLLTTALAGSGCVVDNCNDRTLTVDWSFVDRAGIAGLVCNDLRLTADVVSVDVFVDGNTAATGLSCGSYGVTLSGYASGRHDVMVEGLDAGGFVITRDWFTVDVASCGDTAVVASPGQANLELNYAVTTGTCGGGYIWYSLTDVYSNQAGGIGSDSLCADRTSRLCSDTSAYVVTVPYGPQRLDWIQSVPVTSCTGGTASVQSCAAVQVTVDAPTPTVPFDLPVSMKSSCP
jgi:hypothetical protein